MTASTGGKDKSSNWANKKLTLDIIYKSDDHIVVLKINFTMNEFNLDSNNLRHHNETK